MSNLFAEASEIEESLEPFSLAWIAWEMNFERFKLISSISCIIVMGKLTWTAVFVGPFLFLAIRPTSSMRVDC